MLTKKQNLLETIKGGSPDRFVNQYEAFDCSSASPFGMIYSDPVVADSPMPSPGGASQNGFKLFWDAITRKYGSGAGRASVQEYWAVNIGAAVMFFGGIGLDASMAVDDEGYATQFVPIFSVIVLLAMIIPSVAVMARRIHDLGHKADVAKAFALSGQLMSSRGTPGPNQYGPDPLDPGPIQGNAR